MIISAYYDGIMNIREGDLISIIRGIEENNNKIRITRYELEPKKGEQFSDIDKMQMEKRPYDFDPPIHGRVEEFQIKDEVTTLSFRPGVYLPNSVFIESGDRSGGRNYLKAIFLNEVADYVKICDKYVSGNTLDLLLDLNPEIEVKILGYNFYEQSTYASIINALNAKNITIEIRKVTDSRQIHDRYILSRYYGYIVGHSLKDIGKSDTFISRLQDSSEIESQFDNRWESSTIVM